MCATSVPLTQTGEGLIQYGRLEAPAARQIDSLLDEHIARSALQVHC